MALFWLTYRRGGELAGIAIIELPSLIPMPGCALRPAGSMLGSILRRATDSTVR
jgi:hypothetical protein